MPNLIPLFEIKPQWKSKAEYIVRLLQPATATSAGLAPVKFVLSALRDTVCSLVSTCVRVMYELLSSTHAIWVFLFNHHNRLPITHQWGRDLVSFVGANPGLHTSLVTAVVDHVIFNRVMAEHHKTSKISGVMLSPTDVVYFRYVLRNLKVYCPSLIRSHCDDVIMGAIASQITSLTIVYSTVYSGADQSKYQSSASLALMASNAENASIWWRHHVEL